MRLWLSLLLGTAAGSLAPAAVRTTCAELSEWYYDATHNGTQACCDRPPSHPRVLTQVLEEHAVVLFHNKPRPIAWPSGTAFEVTWDGTNTTALVRLPHVGQLVPFLDALIAQQPMLFWPAFPSIVVHVSEANRSHAIVPPWAQVNVGVFVYNVHIG